MGLGGGWYVDKSGEIHGPSNSNSGSSQSNESSTKDTSNPWDWESAKYTQEQVREAETKQIQEAETKKMLNELRRADDAARKALKAKTPPMSHYDVDRSKAAEEVQKFAKTPEQVFEGAREAIEERALEAHAKGLTEANTVERLKIGAELEALGVAAAAIGVAQGMYEIGKTAAKGNVVGAGEQLVKGTAEWFVSIPRKVKYAFTDSPYFAGQLAGEIIAGEVVGRGAVKAGRGAARGVRLGIDATVRTGIEVLERAKIAKEIAALELDKVKWRVTEPLYQKGVLKAKTETVGFPEKSPNYYEQLYLDVLADEFGWKEMIAKERQEWVKNTDIIDISENGEWVRVETFYKGKRPFKVEREIPSEKVPEKVWERFEEKTQEPKSAFKELNRQAEREFRDLNKALREKWKQREREYQRKMQEGKAVKTGRQIQLLEETAKVEEKAKVKTIERSKARAKAEAILERAAKEMEKTENVFRNRFRMKAFLVPEMRFDQVYRQSLGLFPEVKLRFMEDVFTGQKVSDLTEEATGLGFPPIFPEPTVEIQDLIQQPFQETIPTTATIQTPKLKTDLVIESPKKPKRLKSKSAREEKKKSSRKSRGRKYFEAKNPVLRFEDILEKEGRKYVKKLKAGGKRSKKRR